MSDPVMHPSTQNPPSSNNPPPASNCAPGPSDDGCAESHHAALLSADVSGGGCGLQANLDVLGINVADLNVNFDILDGLLCDTSCVG